MSFKPHITLSVFFVYEETVTLWYHNEWKHGIRFYKPKRKEKNKNRYRCLLQKKTIFLCKCHLPAVPNNIYIYLITLITLMLFIYFYYLFMYVIYFNINKYINYSKQKLYTELLHTVPECEDERANYWMWRCENI